MKKNTFIILFIIPLILLCLLLSYFIYGVLSPWQKIDYISSEECKEMECETKIWTDGRYRTICISPCWITFEKGKWGEKKNEIDMEELVRQIRENYKSN